jgi:hypothetical protein
MIRSFKKLQGIQISTLDGVDGALKDVYFDDRSWNVRYFVVETRSRFSEKDVLVLPNTVSSSDGKSINIKLTKTELQTCPDAGSAKPVTLQQRYKAKALFDLIRSSGNFWNGEPLMIPSFPKDDQEGDAFDPHLRSCKYISRYELIANDGDVGPVQDFLIDDSLWLIRFAVAVINSGSEDQERLFGPQIIENIEWALEVVKIAATRKEALSKPHFNAIRHLDTSYEVFVNDIYGSSDGKKLP